MDEQPTDIYMRSLHEQRETKVLNSEIFNRRDCYIFLKVFLSYIISCLNKIPPLIRKLYNFIKKNRLHAFSEKKSGPNFPP